MVKQYPVPFHTEKTNKEDVKKFHKTCIIVDMFLTNKVLNQEFGKPNLFMS